MAYIRLRAAIAVTSMRSDESPQGKVPLRKSTARRGKVVAAAAGEPTEGALHWKVIELAGTWTVPLSDDVNECPYRLKQCPPIWTTLTATYRQ